ncbi:MAG TPA: hypothetical protein VNK50_10895 [Calidithermus sp.]|nr:hypothetical protein [Calidithermus sp.]
MLASRLFARAERHRRFLEFIVTETLAGRGDRLKGYTIGVHVFDRAPDFDPTLDAIVRVEAARLRAKLREYYDEEGRWDPVRFGLPKGSYRPLIVQAAAPRPRPEPEPRPAAGGRNDPLCPGAVHPGARECLLRGIEAFWGYTPPASQNARELFARAVALDPGWAAGHAWLARAQAFRWVMGWAADAAVLDDALAHAGRAVDLDPGLPLAHSVLGWVRLWRHEPAAALQAGRQALALDPASAEAHAFVAVTLAASGRGEDALCLMNAGIRLHPHPSAFHLWALGCCYWVLGAYERAREAFERGVRARYGFVPNHLFLCLTHTALGRPRQARLARARLDRLGQGALPQEMWIDADLRRRVQILKRRAGLEPRLRHARAG